ESVLGLELENGETLVVKPCIPDEWPGFTLTWRPPVQGGATGRSTCGGSAMALEITVRNPHACSATVVRARLDGAPVPVREGAARVALRRPGAGTHRLEVELGPEGRR